MCLKAPTRYENDICQNLKTKTDFSADDIPGHVGKTIHKTSYKKLAIYELTN